MSDDSVNHKVISNYCLFEELDSDSLGISYRVGEIIDQKVEKHWLLTEVYPSLSGDPLMWKRISVLMEGIKKPGIPGLYCHERIFKEGEKAYVLYPYVKGKSLETILEDTSRNNNPMEVELIFSIALDIADVLETGTTIIINKKKSFHGILTPDNIVIDLDGKISLKNYGVFPFLLKDPKLLTETRKKFAGMLAPEFMDEGQLSPQVDIYHLGNIIHRLLTGEYFHYSAEKDFESQLSGFKLTEHILEPEEGFTPKVLELFRRSLNPDPSKRFPSIKEFKDYVSRNFHIEELSSATFIIAYFMNQVYMKSIEEEDQRLNEELSVTLPRVSVPIVAERPADEGKIDEHVIEDILIELEQQKRSRKKTVIPLVAIIVVILVLATYIIINQQKQAREREEAYKQEYLKKTQELEQSMAQMRSGLLSEYQKRLKTIEDKATSTEEEKKAREKEVEDLKKWRQEQERKTEERYKAQKQALNLELKKRRQEQKKQQEVKAVETQPPPKTVETTKPAAEQTAEKPLVKEELQPEKKPGPPIIKEGDIVPIESVTFTPSKLKGKRTYKAETLNLSKDTLDKYAGQTLTIRSDILIDEKGAVTDVKTKEKIPAELQAKSTEIFKTWAYVPPEKDKTKVKVWMPAEMTLTFAGIRKQIALPEDTAAVPLDSVTYRPSKLRGERKVSADELEISASIKRKYKGKSLTVRAAILINEHGIITKVDIKSDVPGEIKAKATKILKTWKYVPAEKDKEKVKVWFPARLIITF